MKTQRLFKGVSSFIFTEKLCLCKNIKCIGLKKGNKASALKLL